MEMSDALMIGGTQHWGGGDEKFGIGIAYGLQGSLFHMHNKKE